MRALGYVQRFGVGLEIARAALAANGNPPLELKSDSQPRLRNPAERAMSFPRTLALTGLVAYATSAAASFSIWPTSSQNVGSASWWWTSASIRPSARVSSVNAGFTSCGLKTSATAGGEPEMPIVPLPVSENLYLISGDPQLALSDPAASYSLKERIVEAAQRIRSSWILVSLDLALTPWSQAAFAAVSRFGNRCRRTPTAVASRPAGCQSAPE